MSCHVNMTHVVKVWWVSAQVYDSLDTVQKHNDEVNRRERESRRQDSLPFSRRANGGRVAEISDLPVTGHESWRNDVK